MIDIWMTYMKNSKLSPVRTILRCLFLKMRSVCTNGWTLSFRYHETSKRSDSQKHCHIFAILLAEKRIFRSMCSRTSPMSKCEGWWQLKPLGKRQRPTLQFLTMGNDILLPNIEEKKYPCQRKLIVVTSVWSVVRVTKIHIDLIYHVAIVWYFLYAFPFCFSPSFSNSIFFVVFL